MTDLSTTNYATGEALAASDLDMLVLRSGDILAVVGNWETWPVRARLCYYRDPAGAARIGSRTFTKVTYEAHGAIADTEQLLRLPGENHYAVGRGIVTRRLAPAPLALGEPADIGQHARAFAAAGLTPRLIGSRLLGCAGEASDYDWGIWCHHPDQVRAVVETEHRSRPHLHFGFDHAQRKYRHFTRLDAVDLARLFEGRWRHVTWPECGYQMSYLPVDAAWRADPWRDLQRTGEHVDIAGTVTDADHGHYAPTLLGLDTDAGPVRVGTWLFLYRGAFNVGDVVRVFGERAESPSGPMIYVEGSDHAIIKC